MTHLTRIRRIPLRGADAQISTISLVLLACREYGFSPALSLDCIAAFLPFTDREQPLHRKESHRAPNHFSFWCVCEKRNSQFSLWYWGRGGGGAGGGVGGVMTVEPCLFHSFGNDCRVSEEGRAWTCSPLWKQDTGTIMHRVACLCGPSLRKGARRESYLQLRRITKDVGRSKWVTIHHAVQVWHTSASLPTAG